MFAQLEGSEPACGTHIMAWCSQVWSQVFSFTWHSSCAHIRVAGGDTVPTIEVVLGQGKSPQACQGCPAGGQRACMPGLVMSLVVHMALR